MKLSQHFSYEEMTRSDFATRHNIVNVPNMMQLKNMQFLCLNTLEPLREAWGAPIIVTSGFRCPEVNKGVGGTANSQHLRGEAADILPKNLKDITKLYMLANKICDFDQLLFEYNKSDGKVRCIHISTKIDPKQNRHYACEKYLL